MRLPIGYSDFGAIVRGNMTFVDKTLFIKEIFDSTPQVSVIVRPRRFGKTLNLSMLQHFLAATVYGQPSKGLFDQLKIAALGETYMQYQGQFPVIYISFKDIKDLNFAAAYEALCLLMRTVFSEHYYLLSSSHLNAIDKDFCQTILEGHPSVAHFSQSLKILTKCLYEHHGKKPWLLIDEYDTPIQASYYHGYYDQMISLIRNLLGSALKDNGFLDRAVVTGIMRVSKESIFSGLNNVTVYSVWRAKFGEYFGFTEAEVKGLLAKSGIEHLSEKIRSWYNGYYMGNTTIYNPWSIINCIDNQGELKPYWVNTSDNGLIKLLLAKSSATMKTELESLVQNESITALIDENIVFGDLEKSSDSLWSFLVASGYLKIIHSEQKETLIQCELAIPNQEVLALYRRLIKDWLSASSGSEQYLLFLLSLTQGRIDEFAQYLQKYLLETLSYFDASGNEPEKFYHGFVLGLIVSLSETHEVQSNRESGYGRYDVILIPKDPEQLGIILEFKTVREAKTDLKQAACQTVQQINEQQYEAILTQKGIPHILKVGMAFHGKQVEVFATALPEMIV